jgi:hypothetical protein
LSQALVRKADYPELSAFVEWSGLSSATTMTTGETEAALKIWLREDGSRTRLARLLGKDPSRGDLRLVALRILTALPDLEAVGKAQSSRENNLPQAAKPAVLHLYRTGATWAKAQAQAAWREETPLEFDDETVPRVKVGSSGSPTDVHRDAEWSAVDIDLKDALPEGATISDELSDRQYSLESSELLVFAKGDARGRRGWWIAIPDLGAIGEEIVVLSAPSRRDDALAILALCEPGWKELATTWAPDAWAVFVGARLARAPEAPIGGRVNVESIPWALAGGVRVRRDSWLYPYCPTIEAEASLKFVIEDAQGERIAEVEGGQDLTPHLSRPGAYRIIPEDGRARPIVITQATWPVHPLAKADPATLEVAPGVTIAISGAFVDGIERVPEFKDIPIQRVLSPVIPPPAVAPPPRARPPSPTRTSPKRPPSARDEGRVLRQLRRGRAVTAISDLDGVPAIHVVVAASRGQEWARAFKDMLAARGPNVEPQAVAGLRRLENLFDAVYLEALADASGDRKQATDKWTDAQLRAVTVCLWAVLDERHFSAYLKQNPLPRQFGETLKWLKTARQHAPRLTALLDEVRAEYEGGS